MADKIEEMISTTSLAERIAELAAEIERDLQPGLAGKPLMVIGVLNGAFIFLADLVRQLRLPLQIDFLRVASYGDSTETTGIVEIRKDLEQRITDRDVLLVEDIVDTGLTLTFLVKHLSLQQPRSLKTCCLLDKTEKRRVPFDADYVGFAIPDKYVVGYGLDSAERYRELPSIGVVVGTSDE